MVDREGCVLRANRTIESWLSTDVREISGTRCHDLIHPDCTEPQCGLQNRLAREWPGLLQGKEAAWEFFDKCSGKHFSVRVRGLCGEEEADQQAQEGFATVVLEDITLEKQARKVLDEYNVRLEAMVANATALLTEANSSLNEQVAAHIRDKEALRESEAKYASLVNTTQTGLYILIDGRVSFCNHRFAQILGRSEEQILGVGIEELMQCDASDMRQELSVKQGVMSVPELVHGWREDNEEFWLSQSATPILYKGHVALLGNVVDITPLHRALEDLEHSNLELEALYRSYLNVQEQERQRVASDLHDGIGQTLSGIKFGLENALREIDDRLGRPCLRLHDVLKKLQIGIDEVRRTAMNLRPATLDHLGIVATINWFCREFQSEVTGIRIIRAIDVVEDQIPEPLKVVIFRIIQETFNNIAKHAMADTVSLELALQGESVVLSIQDNGIGITPTGAQSSSDGLGLVGMRERAEHANGSLTIQSTPHQGTRVRAEWPLDASRAAMTADPAGTLTGQTRISGTAHY